MLSSSCLQNEHTEESHILQKTKFLFLNIGLMWCSRVYHIFFMKKGRLEIIFEKKERLEGRRAPDTLFVEVSPIFITNKCQSNN